MSDRKAELERKKQKLELMRKERQEKERLRKLKEVRDWVSDTGTSANLQKLSKIFK